MATAKKTASGKWKVRVYDYIDENKKKHYKAFTADTKKEAERLALAYEHKAKNNIKTFGEMMDDYLELNSNVLSPATLRSYNSMAKVLRKDYAKFCAKSNIRQEDVQELINTMAKTRSPKTVKNYNGLISVILGDSREFKNKLPQLIKPSYYVPKRSDYKAIMDTVKDTPLEIPVLLGSICMMRRSEICALKITDIDDDNIAHIHSGLVRDTDGYYVSKKTAKTMSSDRYTELPQDIVDKIKKQGYVTEMTPAAITDAFHRVVVKLGLTGMRFHDLRHFGATVRHSLGVPNAIIQAEGGWKNEYTLTQIYRHAMDEDRKQYTEKTNKAFKKMMT